MGDVLDSASFKLSEQAREVLEEKFGIFREALEVLSDENSDDDARRTAWYSIEDANKFLKEEKLLLYSPFNKFGGLNVELLESKGLANPLIADFQAACAEWNMEIDRDVNPMFMPAGGPPPYNYKDGERHEENVSRNKQGDWTIFPKVGQ